MANSPSIDMVCVTDDCARSYPLHDLRSNCDCFAPLRLRYQDVTLSRETISSRPRNMFRYRELLPISAVPGEDSPLFNVGYTSLTQADDLGSALGMYPGKLYIKGDVGIISDSFKDRGVAVTGLYVKEHHGNFRAIAGTSTGNLAASIAANAKILGFPGIVVVHAEAEEALIRKALAHGAYVLQVEGDYSKANKRLNDALRENEELANYIAWVNIRLRPIYAHGSKALGFEIAEQLGWKTPQNVVHPVAAGLSFANIYRGFGEFQQLGLIDSIADLRMHAVQTETCDPIVRTWAKGDWRNGDYTIDIVKPKKAIAETLSVGDPTNGYEVLRALEKSRGSAVAVSDDDTLWGMGMIDNHTDFAGGPVAGTVIAGLRRLLETQQIRPDHTTVAVLTDVTEKGYAERKSFDSSQRLCFHVPSDSEAIRGTLENILNGL